ncbi:hypothetical protein L0152_20345 [bacterium]|nr:hypothetical protein [bacterium]
MKGLLKYLANGIDWKWVGIMYASSVILGGIIAICVGDNPLSAMAVAFCIVSFFFILTLIRQIEKYFRR